MSNDKRIRSLMARLESEGIDPSDKERAVAAMESTVLPTANVRDFLALVYTPDAKHCWKITNSKGEQFQRTYSHKRSAERMAEQLSEISMHEQPDNPQRWTVEPL